MPVSPGASPFRTQFRSSAMRPSGRGGGRALAYPDGVPLTGASGSYIRCPDSAALSFSNDIEVVMLVKPTDWSAVANQTLCGKYVATGNQRSWRMYSSTTGSIVTSASVDGTAVTSVSVVPSVALTDNTWTWLRIRLDLTNGSNSVATLETAADVGFNAEPSSWTANGTSTGTVVASVFDSSAPLELGAFSAGTSERLTGRVRRFVLRSGFGGSVVADFNSELSGQSGYSDAYGNTWVI